jgi:hypothetical protein
MEFKSEADQEPQVPAASTPAAPQPAPAGAYTDLPDDVIKLLAEEEAEEHRQKEYQASPAYEADQKKAAKLMEEAHESQRAWHVKHGNEQAVFRKAEPLEDKDDFRRPIHHTGWVQSAINEAKRLQEEYKT